MQPTYYEGDSGRQEYSLEYEDYLHERLINEHGDENGKMLHHLIVEQFRLIQNWRTFLFLYCGDERRIDVLNEASGVFFSIVSGALWDTTLMTLRRLHDRNLSGPGGRNENIGIHRLVDFVPDERKQSQVDLNALAATAFKNVGADVSKSLAHNDLPTFLDGNRFHSTRGEITESVRTTKAAIDGFLYDDPLQVGHEFPISEAKDEQAMLAKLFVGNLKYEEVLREEVTRDLQNGPMAQPVKIIPEWLWDMGHREKPF